MLMDVGSDVLNSMDIDVDYYVDRITSSKVVPPDELSLYAMSHLCNM